MTTHDSAMHPDRSESGPPQRQPESTAGSQVFQLQAQGTVLDASYTLSGDKIAIITDAGIIQVWDCTVTKPQWQLLHNEQLQLQEVPTQLAWCHPQHGLVLAVGTTRGNVYILQGPAFDTKTGSSSCSSSSIQRHLPAPDQHRVQQRPSDGWCITASLQCGHEAVSAMAFGPRQHGLVLAVTCQQRSVQQGVSAGGNILLFEGSGAASSCLKWTQLSRIELDASCGACSCLCWHEAAVGLPPLLVGGHNQGGCIWAYDSPTMNWQKLASFSAPHTSGSKLLAVHWAPALGRPYELLAASFGTTVVVYKVQQAAANGSASASEQQQQQQQPGPLDVVAMQELEHSGPVFRLEFNMLGNSLACSLDGKPEVCLWMPAMDGTWQAVTKLQGRQPSEPDMVVD